MRALNQEPSLADFYRRLRTAPKRALLLDYDGTLAPFHIRTNEALPYAGVREILDTIAESGHTRLVIVSGRWTRDLKPLLGLKRLPEIWGSHGWEQLKPDGEYAVASMDEKALRHLVEADAWTAEVEAKGGRCEMKPGSLAIHWRGLKPKKIGEIRDLVSQNWNLLEMGKNLVWHEFDGGIELRVPGRHKGMVVETILSEMGPETAAAYLGDDTTDEDAFRAIRGRGIGVLVRPQFRATAADFWLQSPAELLDFLQQWNETSGGTK
ncbi:MAG: trehalose-phosphatase [Sulfuricaulis sp.]|nr:trehalose-phosphatase [Sulfuricaulis sp.]